MKDFAKYLTDNGWEQDINDVFYFKRNELRLVWDYNYILITDNMHMDDGYTIFPADEDTLKMVADSCLNYDKMKMYRSRMEMKLALNQLEDM